MIIKIRGVQIAECLAFLGLRYVGIALLLAGGGVEFMCYVSFTACFYVGLLWVYFKGDLTGVNN